MAHASTKALGNFSGYYYVSWDQFYTIRQAIRDVIAAHPENTSGATTVGLTVNGEIVPVKVSRLCTFCIVDQTLQQVTTNSSDDERPVSQRALIDYAKNLGKTYSFVATTSSISFQEGDKTINTFTSQDGLLKFAQTGSTINVQVAIPIEKNA